MAAVNAVGIRIGRLFGRAGGRPALARLAPVVFAALAGFIVFAGPAAIGPGVAAQTGAASETRVPAQAGTAAATSASATSAPATAASAPAATAAGWNVATLLEEIARTNPPKARFVERRFVAALDEPVDTSGELLFVRPSRLEKRVLKPRPETLVLDGDELIIERGGQRRSFSLRQVPEAGALVESLRSTLAGDRATLERLFVIRLEGSPAQWQLFLDPKGAEASRLLRQVRMSGMRGRVDLIEIDQSNGDRSVMRVLH